MCVCVFHFKMLSRYELSIAKKHQERKTTRVLSSVCVGGGGGGRFHPELSSFHPKMFQVYDANYCREFRRPYLSVKTNLEWSIKWLQAPQIVSLCSKGNHACMYYPILLNVNHLNQIYNLLYTLLIPYCHPIFGLNSHYCDVHITCEILKWPFC